MMLAKKFKQKHIIAYTDNTGPYTTGPHLHWNGRLLRQKENGGWEIVDRDNGYFGYFDMMLLTNNEPETSMKIIKGARKPHIYLLNAEGSKKILIIDMPTLDALGQSFEIKTEAEIASIPTNGTMVWADRIIN